MNEVISSPTPGSPPPSGRGEGGQDPWTPTPGLGLLLSEVSKWPDGFSQESFTTHPAAKRHKRRFPKTSVGTGLGPTPGCDQRRGGAGPEEELGLFLKTRSQKDHVLVLMSQTYVTRGGDRTQGAKGCPPRPLGQAGAHTGLSHAGGGETQAHTQLSQEGADGFRLWPQGRGPAPWHGPAVPYMDGGGGASLSQPARVHLGLSAGPSSASLVGQAVCCPMREVWAGKKKIFAKSELKILSPPNQGRASWPAASEAS